MQRAAPASCAARLSTEPMSRSLCPCQSMSTSELARCAFGEPNEGARAIGRRVTDGVGDAQPLRTGIERRPEEPAHRIGVGARRVFGDVHDREAVLPRTRSPLR